MDNIIVITVLVGLASTFTALSIRDNRRGKLLEARAKSLPYRIMRVFDGFNVERAYISHGVHGSPQSLEWYSINRVPFKSLELAMKILKENKARDKYIPKVVS